MVDPNIRPWVIGDADSYRRRLRRVLARSDVVKVSEEDLAWLEPQRSAAAAARMLLQAGPRRRAAHARPRRRPGGDRRGRRAGGRTEVEVADTIGAGDAFGGGFLAWWRSQGFGRDELANQDAVVAAATFGALVAARTVERPGASPPFLHELGLDGAVGAGRRELAVRAPPVRWSHRGRRRSQEPSAPTTSSARSGAAAWASSTSPPTGGSAAAWR